MSLLSWAGQSSAVDCTTGSRFSTGRCCREGKIIDNEMLAADVAPFSGVTGRFDRFQTNRLLSMPSCLPIDGTEYNCRRAPGVTLLNNVRLFA
eukprot:6203049-Pleurochrysis_carterae.AAC.5